MEGGTLGDVLGKDPITSLVTYLAVLSLEELPIQMLDNQKTIALVVNTHPDPTEKIVGEHWIAIYGDNKNPQMEYFDSYGQPPFRDDFHRFFHHQKRPWIYNQRTLQDEASNACGYYCLFYLLLRCRGHRMKDITLPFTNNRKNNDKLVKEFIHEHFTIPWIP